MRDEFTRALECRIDRGLEPFSAIHPGLRRLLFGSVGRSLAAQPNLAIEAELQVAVAVLEKFVDDRAFARADYLEEGDLRVPH